MTDTTASDKPRRKRQAGPTPYIIAEDPEGRLHANDGGAVLLTVRGTFGDLKTANRALKDGKIVGEGLILLAVRRVFKSVRVEQKPRTVIE